uniref:Uncharacterized protein n=1 Tax=Arundo donax TaxID=35708 RepID=A0A0A9HMC5_ARUDO
MHSGFCNTSTPLRSDILQLVCYLAQQVRSCSVPCSFIAYMLVWAKEHDRTDTLPCFLLY